MTASEAWFTTQDIAARYRTAASTVRYWRSIDYGPRGCKVGSRVLYSRAEVDRFETELQQKSRQAS